MRPLVLTAAVARRERSNRVRPTLGLRQQAGAVVVKVDVAPRELRLAEKIRRVEGIA
jgi:hypothetical protein